MDLDHHPTQEEITEFLLKNEGLGETTFSGFSENTISFLKNISKNNNKEWFEAHKQEYQDYVLKPLKSFVNDLAEWMLCIDPDLEIRPQINKTISKIQRDIRFSRNKLPYKDTVWVAFKRPVPDWKDTPTFFFELSAVSYRYGMGMYDASSKTMENFRMKIDNDPEAFMSNVLFLSKQKTFRVAGEKYKKIWDKNKPEEIMDWYQRKNIYLVCQNEINDRLFDKLLMDDMLNGFGQLTPFYYYLWDVKLCR